MRVAAVLVSVWLLAGCSRAEVFTCDEDAQCVDDDRQGVCEPGGSCSFPDPMCESGKRHGEYSGAGLAGTCVEVLGCDGPCGPCETCEGGQCVVSAGSPCEIECGDYVSGLKENDETRSCVAFASGAGAGSCDAAGQCVFGPEACSGEGAVLAECTVACALAEHGCVAWAPAETIVPDDLCVTMVETPACQSSCVDGGNGQASTFTQQGCDAAGMCVAAAPTTCNGHICAGNVCATSCAKQTECVEMTMCSMASNTCE